MHVSIMRSGANDGGFAGEQQVVGDSHEGSRCIRYSSRSSVWTT